tara:strand:+ start:2274 stop:2909 length:636 start_codon:yes stop_codon:yes gene_type:complete
VRIDLHSPGGKGGFDKTENKVKVAFMYGRSSQLENGTYTGAINNTAVEFIWNADEKVHIAEFDLNALGEGEHELEFVVEGLELENDFFTIFLASEGEFPGFDGFGGPDDFYRGEQEGAPSNIFLIIGALVVVLAVFTFIVWFLVLRKKKGETIDELKEESKRLKELLKRIEIDYYKRRLNETEYKKRALEYQTRLEETMAKLKAKGEVKKK